MLKLLYGNDTRSVRVLNLSVHLMWCYLIIAHLSNIAVVNLPEKIEPSFNFLLGISILTVVITCFTFVNSFIKVRLKYVSLMLGSVTQLLISLKYITAYPPFDVMVIVCSLLAVWFLFGAIYINSLYKKGHVNVVGDSQ